MGWSVHAVRQAGRLVGVGWGVLCGLEPVRVDGWMDRDVFVIADNISAIGNWRRVVFG